MWNARTGYPGHPDYRDFYRDQGHELEEGHLKDYLAPYGHRKMTGLKYHRITGGRGPKEIYDIEAGRARAVADAENFIESRLRQVEALGAGEQTPPVFTAPFDAELFGHWWWEGHIFLESLIRRIANIPGDIALVTPLDYLKLCPESHEARISPSSWGLGGHSEMWLDPSNDWIYPHLHKACREMEGLAALYPEADEVMKRALDQAAKELTLAQASDWPFMMKTGVMREYAEGRFKEHMVNFRRLKDGILSGNMDIPALEAMETRHPLFKGLDFSVFGG